MTSAAAIAGTAQPSARWPRILLLIAAFLKLIGGLGDLPVLFGDTSEIPGPGLGGAIILAKIVSQPLLAMAALLLALRGKISYALIAMALIILMSWLSLLPSVRLHGLGLEDLGEAGMPAFGETFVMAMLLWEVIVTPAIALAVAALALAEKRLLLATVLAILPTLVATLSVVAFGIGVAIYGF
jgi:hypothetical protein